MKSCEIFMVNWRSYEIFTVWLHRKLTYPPVSSNMACWKMDHRNQWFSYQKLHSVRGFSSHVWWNQRISIPWNPIENQMKPSFSHGFPIIFPWFPMFFHGFPMVFPGFRPIFFSGPPSRGPFAEPGRPWWWGGDGVCSAAKCYAGDASASLAPLRSARWKLRSGVWKMKVYCFY